MKPPLNEVITAGKKPFNPNVLSKALQIYDDKKHCNDYFGGSYDDPRALLFVQKVMGYDGIQRFMPANYVQAFQDGLDNTIKKLQNHKTQRRSTLFAIYRSGNWALWDFYPLPLRGTVAIDFAVFACHPGFPVCCPGGAQSRHFIAYVNQKQQAYETDVCATRLSIESTKSSCAIM